MSPTLKSALLLATSAIALASVLPSPHPGSLETRDCGTEIFPSGFWQIYREDGDEFTNLFPFAPNGSAEFLVSRGNNNAYQHDLVVSFDNVPCPPAGMGPYSIEFFYTHPAVAQYAFSGNTLIDMFAIDGSLPTASFGADPTWDNIEPLTGSLIGTFQLPTDGDDSDKLISINSVTCQPTINLRFGITDSNLTDGSVQWYQDNDEAYFQPGLRLRYGC